MVFRRIWFGFTHPVCVSDLGIGPADCWQCVARVDGRLCLVQRLQVVTGIFKIAALECKLSEYFYKAFHSGQDGDNMRRHDKMTKISFSFFA